MKIAILSFYSGHLERGVENWTHEIATRLAKKHKVTVFQNGSSRSLENYKEVSTKIKVNWKAKDSRGTWARLVFIDYWSLLIAFFTLKALPSIFRKKYDFVIPTNGGWQVSLVRLVTWIYGGKLVVVGHSGRGWDDRNNLWSFPDCFVALSTPARKWAKKANPLVKLAYIPNGIDLKVFNPKGKKAKVPLNEPIILTVGAPERGKRMELAIKAVSKLKNASLLILGGGYEEKRIRSLGKRHLGKRFLIKQVSFGNIPSYYRAADLFTLPAWKNEAFGIVYLEAMASGLPVVATDDKERREIVGDAGILVNPENINLYFKALDKALKKKWGNIPPKQAEKFSWNEVVKKYERLFASLVK